MTKALQWKDTMHPLQMATSAEFLCLTMGLTPKKATTSRSLLYGERYSCQRYGCYHPQRKFAECPCCNVGPLPVFPVMSCLIKSVLSQVIHMYSHTYNHTYIHTCMHAINCVFQCLNWTFNKVRMCLHCDVSSLSNVFWDKSLLVINCIHSPTKQKLIAVLLPNLWESFK